MVILAGEPSRRVTGWSDSAQYARRQGDAVAWFIRNLPDAHATLATPGLRWRITNISNPPVAVAPLVAAVPVT